MTDEERTIATCFCTNSACRLSWNKIYSDSFYDYCIKNHNRRQKRSKGYFFFKRVSDIFLSIVGILILIIPFAIIWICIKVETPGPAIIKNIRVGKNKYEFGCFKFRTLKAEAPPNIISTPKFIEKYKTRTGIFLRKTGLDELPQLFNVLKGDMSLVGYRPLIPVEIDCNNMRAQLGVFKFRPGITGYSQINGREKTYYKNKAIMDAFYINNASVAFDIKIMLGTLKIICQKLPD